ncbi:MAG: formylglycine-generating enzyme family protein [Gammaproteobacteria bacterium]|nr:formylglycine-generating enzyme family protein [Gammaproteobacteria bacterium]MBU1655598.1 formylglycine-generating enzyme family protein [Gammaproteobacteria bacterium]MBU1962270.1 formylglycine-generating enzyme family protein [Gammaproteobacteria bacterium]
MQSNNSSLAQNERKKGGGLRAWLILVPFALAGCVPFANFASKPPPRTEPGPIQGTLPAEPTPATTATRESALLPPVEVKLDRDPITGMEFVQIKGGCFDMGGPAREVGHQSYEKQHRVCVGDFSLGKTEVTNAQFRRFNPKHSSSQYKGVSFDGDNQPVVNIDWNEATAYAQWLSKESGKKYRLPTEAEWEFAARAGTQTARFWGETSDRACHYANVHDRTSRRVNTDVTWKNHNCDDGRVMTAPVGSYQVNPWGLHDMLGNVWEWSCSTYDPRYGGAEKQCSGKDETSRNRSLRGGSWLNEPNSVRSAHRINLSPGYRYSNIGFRLLLEGAEQL